MPSMSTACPKCGSLYDLAVYQPGQRLRCRCGQIIVKPEKSPQYHAARVFHCSACGGALEQGRHDCAYCGAVIDMTDTRLTAYCASCLAMSKEGAQFCSECGIALVEAVDTPEEADEICPRCSVAMRRRSVGSHRPLECPMCCGLFVDAPDLESMIRDQEERVAEESSGAADRPERARLASAKVVYLKCPVCRSIMNRVNYGRVSGVIIDWCGDHGYWLDAGELEKIAKWVATGGLKDKYQREIDEMKAERDRLSAAAAATSMHASTYEVDGAVGGAYLTGGLLGLIAGLFDR
jgi:Zn-finger nucleic acid-binding protein